MICFINSQNILFTKTQNNLLAFDYLGGSKYLNSFGLIRRWMFQTVCLQITPIKITVFKSKCKHKADVLLILFFSQFKEHVSSLYSYMCELVTFDIKMELRSILRRLFTRKGPTFGIVTLDDQS